MCDMHELHLNRNPKFDSFLILCLYCDHMYNLLCGASILHHSGGLHII